jgi:sugar lactone lactonase YvrE
MDAETKTARRRMGRRHAAGVVMSVLCLGVVLHAVPVLAQSLPPIYERVPVHPVPANTIASFGVGEFLENLAVAPDGTLYVTSYEAGKVYRVTREGQVRLWASVDGTLAGIVLNPDGSAVLSGWIGGKEPALFTVDADGRSRVALRLPGAQFPNGMLRWRDGVVLVADSYRGVIWRADLTQGRAEVWLDHDSLARASADNPTPAANGIKRHGDAVYVSNTAKQLLVKIPIVDGQAGTPEVVQRDLGLDDFDFDSTGTLYGATHVYNTVVRRSPSGELTVIAGLPQGMAGSTAVAYSPAGGGQLFVTTNGGVSLPPPGGVQAGRVVRLGLR